MTLLLGSEPFDLQTTGGEDRKLHHQSPTLNIGGPQVGILSPLLYSLYNHYCKATYSYNLSVKFADDTVVVSLISNGREITYLEEMEALSSWCKDNNLDLNISKTKEMVLDFRREKQRNHHSSHDLWDSSGESSSQLQVTWHAHL